MEYTVNKLAEISGVTVRTLHHYDNIGLLCPKRNPDNGYRSYGEEEIDKLQQILLYKELGFPLQQINEIMKAPDFKREEALRRQLGALIEKKNQMEQVIITVQRTICNLKESKHLSVDEKFYGLKQQVLETNEKTFGKELRKHFGNDQIDKSKQKIMSMNYEEWNNLENLEVEILHLLKQAFLVGNPGSETAQKVCRLHKEWLCSQWKDGLYSKEIHLALAEGYVLDSRFTDYYDKIGKGATIFLRDAIAIYVRI